MITKNIAKTERTPVGHHTNTARTVANTVRTAHKHCTAGELHQLANTHAGLTRLKAELKGVHTTFRQRNHLTQATVQSLILTTPGRHLVPFWAVERNFFDFGCILGSFWAPPGLIFDQF